MLGSSRNGCLAGTTGHVTVLLGYYVSGSLGIQAFWFAVLAVVFLLAKILGPYLWV